ncbi:hypothetical protein CEUSTIGMA_g11222.t1 [Chlamydomonas eustigma]|uniref:glycerophosphodiester phosphodiesterase n=1 Tax=Chlamydomonas eustigma TaxID=1157962 RepID=A0A250XL46_9CHLO|nr:hypothetical protein CEUSTIGMA_g11222.t1 [Chlamydomonas eustigma]|eukprot:GAX83797.1 hypothetical protein CEUSTIGMA_g11222.t1 [Chlamydomonas eustigma]
MGNAMARVAPFIQEPSAFAKAWPQTPRICFPIAVYSHRGGPMEGFVENSMQAFRNSAKLKVDLLELDVQLTKDGKIVVYHDKDMGHLFGSSYVGKRIHDFNYEELPTFQDAHGISTNTAITYSTPQETVQSPADTTALSAGYKTQPPLLEKVFEEFPEFPIQVDIKSDTPGLVEATLGLINKYPGRKNLVLIGSFIPSVNTKIYQLAPDLPLFTSSKRLLYLLGCYYLGLLSMTHIYESAIIIPWRMPLFKSLGWFHYFINRGFFSALNKRGSARKQGPTQSARTSQACCRN